MHKICLPALFFLIISFQLKAQTQQEIQIDIRGIPLKNSRWYGGSAGYLHSLGKNWFAGGKITMLYEQDDLQEANYFILDCLLRYPVFRKNRKFAIYMSGGLSVMYESKYILPDKDFVNIFFCPNGSSLTAADIERQEQMARQGYFMYHRINPGLTVYSEFVWHIMRKWNAGIGLMMNGHYVAPGTNKFLPEDTFQLLLSPALQMCWLL